MNKSVTQDAKTGRIMSSGLLSERQAEFVKHFANGANGSDAARMAGYSGAATEAYRLQLLPHIQQAIQQEQARVIAIEGSQLAWKTMQRLMSDRQTPANVQYQCARWTLEAAGQGLASRAQKAGMLTPGGKSLTEMSVAELERYISEGREALAQSRAVEIASEVISDLTQSGVIPPEMRP